MRSPHPQAVIGFAHRGGMAERPQNTLEAFRHALSRGVRALESDVWLTSDGRPLLSHGPAAAGAPALDALFQECGTDFDLSLDLSVRAVPAVVRVAAAAGHDPARLWLCGSGPGVLGWRPAAPGVHLVSDARWGQVLPHPGAFLPRLRQAGVSALNLRRSRWTSGLVARVHAHGLLAFAWDVQTKARLRAALDMGCDAVYSDHVELLVRCLGGTGS